jgi:hypothetical protein
MPLIPLLVILRDVFRMLCRASLLKIVLYFSDIGRLMKKYTSAIDAEDSFAFSAKNLTPSSQSNASEAAYTFDFNNPIIASKFLYLIAK